MEYGLFAGYTTTYLTEYKQLDTADFEMQWSTEKPIKVMLNKNYLSEREIKQLIDVYNDIKAGKYAQDQPDAEKF